MDVDGTLEGEIPGIDHFSSCSMVAAHVGRMNPGLRLLELGSGFGGQLPFLLPHFSSVTSIDAMYDWVPDLPPEAPFDPKLVCRSKVDGWRAHASPWADRIELVIGSTYEVHRTHAELLESRGPFDVIIVDACHHPASAVEADFWNHERFLAPMFWAVFDDVNQTDPGIAARNVTEALVSRGRRVLTRSSKNGGTEALLLWVE